MEVSEMRAAVEAAWEWAQIRPAEPYEGCNQGRWVARLPLLPLSQTCFENEDEAVEAAYQFTLDRQEQVRQVDEEIAGLEGELLDLDLELLGEVSHHSTSPNSCPSARNFFRSSLGSIISRLRSRTHKGPQNR